MTRTEEEKQRLKSKILTDFYNSPTPMIKIEGMCRRHSIRTDSKIAEDCLQETMMHLVNWCNKNIDTLMEMYDDKERPNRLLSMFVRIAVWKCFSKTSSNYPKHSIAFWILNFSNINSMNYYNPCEATEDEHNNKIAGFGNLVLLDEPEETDPLWELIRSNLTPDELVDLDFFLNQPKKRGQDRKELKEKYQHLLKRIETIIVDSKINL